MPVDVRRGQAFCSLLEACDPKRLPVHGGDATTVIVTVPLDHAARRAGSGELGPSDTSAPERYAASRARPPSSRRSWAGSPRCSTWAASSRLFKPAQRKAMVIRDRECRAEGCTIPATWCEAHHWGQTVVPGGQTDLKDGVLLCPGTTIGRMTRDTTAVDFPTATSDSVGGGDLTVTHLRQDGAVSRLQEIVDESGRRRPGPGRGRAGRAGRRRRGRLRRLALRRRAGDDAGLAVPGRVDRQADHGGGDDGAGRARGVRARRRGVEVAARSWRSRWCCATPDGPIDDVVPAERAITVRDLLTLRGGHGYPSNFDVTGRRQLLTERLHQGPPRPLEVPPTDEWMARFAEVPLLHQPGEGWSYNTGSDILGVLLARATSGSLGEVLAETILEPLGMADTAFWTTRGGADDVALRARRRRVRAGRPTRRAVDVAASVRVGRRWAGVHGRRLVRLRADAARRWRHQGRQVLSPESVRLMMTSHVEAEPGNHFLDGQGWGFGGGVDVQLKDPWNVPGRYGWVGGTGTAGYVIPSTRHGRGLAGAGRVPGTGGRRGDGRGADVRRAGLASSAARCRR